MTLQERNYDYDVNDYVMKVMYYIPTDKIKIGRTIKTKLQLDTLDNIDI